jgi:RNA polymerase sigma factor (sigma-70 family)
MLPQDESHFKYFAQSLKFNLEKYKDLDDENRTDRQKRQLENLVKLEKDFRKALIDDPKGEAVFSDFITFICDIRRNILDARPYFRERQTVFTKRISPALKSRNPSRLHGFNYNYGFIIFVMKSRKWGKRHPLTKLFKEIHKARNELIEQNMPLAISRAHIFFRSTPTAHLSYLDMIQIAAEGLMSGIDKFCLPYSKKFRHTAIGRMIGNFIENYSQTALHFFPIDKRKIYRANKELRHKDRENIDFEALAVQVNYNLAKEYQTNAAELADLLAASKTISLNVPSSFGGDSQPEGEMNELQDFQPASAEWQPDIQVEDANLKKTLILAINQLPMLERKVLYLKGLHF